MSHQTAPHASSPSSLQDVTKLSPTITRILGQNPGPFTLQGTNTYLIAGHKSSILIDTGQGMPAYLPFLESVLRLNPPVSDIILTHYHRDHVQGLPSTLQAIRTYHQHPDAPGTPPKPRVWKYKLPHHSSDGHSEHDLEIARSCLETAETKIQLANQSEESGQPENHSINWLVSGQAFRISDQHLLRIIHTPGHTDDSISCLLYDDLMDLQAVFVGDTVLGGGTTSVFDNLTAYLHSLRSLRHALGSANAVRLYPGHGQVVEDGQAEIDRYLHHRLEREQQILAVLVSNQQRDPLSTEELLGCMYKSSLPAEVLPAALRGLRLHLQKLVEDGRVEKIRSDQWGLLPLEQRPNVSSKLSPVS